MTPDFPELLARVASALDRSGIEFMVVGGQAVLLHGDPRLTQDVDLTLAAPPSELPTILEACTAAGLDPLPEDVPAFVRRTFVLPALDTASGVRVDFIFSTTPYEAQAIRRAVQTEMGGREIPYASPEDLILHKLFAGRPRDLDDARSVIRRKGDELDRAYLNHWARAFSVVPGREGLPEVLRAMFG